MDFQSFMKREIEKTVFIEIKNDMVIDSGKHQLLPAGFYPILPQAMVSIAKEGSGDIPVKALIDGMLYMIACDPSFKYNNNYILSLKKINDMESYIIIKIEENRKISPKVALVYSTSLCNIFPTRKNKLNRIYELMEYFKLNSGTYIEEEIKYSLERVIEEYPDYNLPCLYLGEYLINSDRDRAKVLLNRALQDSEGCGRAAELLERIKRVEDYDNAVELVKSGRGEDALETLEAVLKENPDNPDVIYYTAVALRQTEEYERALMYLSKLEEAGPVAEVLSEQGLNYAFTGRFQEAAKSFEEALKLKPKDAELLCNEGVCWLNLGNIDKAKEAFYKAQAINPKDEIIAKWLSQLK